MAQLEVIAEFPAYKIVKPFAGRKFKHGEKVGLPVHSARYGLMYEFFRFGSVEGYAMEYGECPLEAAAKFEAAPNGPHYWLGAQAVCLHNGPKVQEVVIGLEWGQEVVFQGKRFKIEKAPNSNAKLVPIAE